jgi:NTP pyrophosphatase (non-canonical NTP hydrolase)
MPMSNRGLNKLMEECGELTQIAAKKAAYPDAQVHPDGQNINVRLEEEIADVIAAANFVMQKFNLNCAAVHHRSELKLLKFQAWDADPNS